MVRDGIFYALALIGGGLLVSYVAGPWWGTPLYLLGAFCLWFFRDPGRVIPPGPVAVSPADGKVVVVAQEADGHTRVSIFLNIFDVHVNRSPVGGVITDICYQKGKFMNAALALASTENEMNTFTVTDGSVTVVFKQIAGLIARRIVCYMKVGDRVEAGQRVGLIKFGSRCDVILGPEWTTEVTPGMRVAAGSSVLARRKETR
ncbi:MAG TPA: phosphatidylserine decarboxylase [Bryobacteraceae bacterium]|jgi:phosphatidylserine decarboxylase